MSRRRLTDEQWRVLVERQARSGVSVGAFCAREGLSASTFFLKRRRLRALPRFVELRAEPGEAGAGLAATAVRSEDANGPPHAAAEARDGHAGAPSLELRLPRGLVVLVGPGFDPALLRAVAEALA